jgi:hypothetical protein
MDPLSTACCGCLLAWNGGATYALHQDTKNKDKGYNYFQRLYKKSQQAG